MLTRLKELVWGVKKLGGIGKRIVHFRKSQPEFCRNYVTTSKYTTLNFVPRNLWAQFHKISNIYFLFICTLQLIKPITTTGGIPYTLLPLILVISANGAKDAYEDWRRHNSDRQENEAITHVIDRQLNKQSKGSSLTPSLEHSLDLQSLGKSATTPPSKEFITNFLEKRLKKKQWQDVEVGDIVCCVDREQIPADMVLIACSNPEGAVFIDTASLDGETNLKLRQTSPACHRMLCDGAESPSHVEHIIKQVRGFIECEPPNDSLNTFEGVLNIGLVESDDAQQRQITLSQDSIGLPQILLRGCKLRNTKWCLGLVVYTGRETKIHMVLHTGCYIDM